MRLPPDETSFDPSSDPWSGPLGAALMTAAPPPRLLHVFSTLTVGGAQARTATLVSAFHDTFEHVFVAVDGRTDALEHLRFAAPWRVRTVAITKVRGVSLGNVRRFRALARDERPALLLTYNFGAIEAALAQRWWPTCPHVHFEDGFGAGENPEHQLPRRVWLRRLALSGASTVVVPSRTLERLAVERWGLAAARVHHLPNGIDLARFESAAAERTRAEDDRDIVVGAVGGLRPEKNLARLLRAVAHAAPDLPLRVVLVGDGPERPRLEEQARLLGLDGRVRFAGQLARPEAALADMDIFALSSDTEQMPLSLIEAMAAGLPVVATDVGDVADMLPAVSRDGVVAATDEPAFAAALERLARDAALRAELGAANRAHARAHFAQETMLSRYAALFETLIGDPLSRPLGSGAVGASASSFGDPR